MIGIDVKGTKRIGTPKSVGGSLKPYTTVMPLAAAPGEKPEPLVDLTGRTLGDFHILRKLGQGGMGTVYLARQQSLKREVALKFLRKDLTENPVALQRFQAEAEAVARISHPNIVQVYSIGEQDGFRFMALEYVEGRNLRDFLDRKGALELPVALTIFRQIAAALQRAGELGLVHRDIKPENILLNRKAEVKVTDFGLSRYFAGEQKPLSLTQSGMTLGTPLYMSPEQVQGKPVDHRSDLYSFGVTAYHALAGQPPFRGQNAFDVAVQHVQANPEPLENLRPDLPPDLCALVRKLMAKNADDRYQSAKDVMRDLARIQKGMVLNAAAEGIILPQSPSLSLPVAVANPSHPSTTVMASPTPRPVSRVWLAVPLGLLALVLGWFAYGATHSNVRSPKSQVVVGLPEARPPSPVVSGLEVELREKFRNRTNGSQHLRTGIQLALLYVRERRFDEAEAVFQEIETAKLPGIPADLPTLPTMVARMGKGIVLAWKDKPQDSVKQFEEAVAKLPVALYRKRVEPFLFENTDFSQAVSEALNRNAENLAAAGQKLPTKLEWLRTPSGLMGGPK
jgi:serine/threonine protein kinase